MDRIDFHNLVIAGLLSFVWVAVVAAMVRVGHPPSSSVCWMATAISAVILAGRVVMHGADLLRAQDSGAADYIFANAAFLIVASLALGQLGGQLPVLLEP